MCNCKWFFRVGCFEQPVSPPGSCTLPPCDKNGATATGLGAVKLPKVQLVPSSKSLPWPLRLKRWCGSGAWQLRRCVFSCIHLSQYIDLWDCFNCARIKLQFLRSCKCKMVPRKHWFLPGMQLVMNLSNSHLEQGALFAQSGTSSWNIMGAGVITLMT